MILLINRLDIQIRSILIVFLVEFLLHNIDNLIENVADLLVASVSTSGCGEDVRI